MPLATKPATEMDRAISCARWGGGLAQSPAILLLSWQTVSLIDFTKISMRPSFAEAYLGLKDPPSHCVGLPFLFLYGGGSWHQHIKDAHGKNLQCGVQALCHGRVPCGSP